MAGTTTKGRGANLAAAKRAKNDEFYTQWIDIEREMNAYIEYDPDVFRGKTILLPCDDPEWSNFTKFFVMKMRPYGIKKLISTSYAPGSKAAAGLTHDDAGDYDENRGRKLVLELDDIPAGEYAKMDDLTWTYLDGDGDFRSDEVTALRDEADIVITNPPFSLFRPFIAWLMEGGVQFSVIGNVNAITYKETFPLIKGNRLWLGPTISSGDREFKVPDSYPLQAAGWRVDDEGNKYIRVKGVRWFTNIEHGRRHEPLRLMSEADNIRFNKKLKGQPYQKYDNYDAIEVPYTDAIPNDHAGVMGVPITFLDKYNPEQFEILGITEANAAGNSAGLWAGIESGRHAYIDGRKIYARIFIRNN